MKENRTVVSKMAHVEVVHDNPAAAAQFMRDVLGAVDVEHGITSWLREKRGLDCYHMMFGGIVYQILKPVSRLASWEALLKREGPAIHNISLQVTDAHKLRADLKAAGAVELSAGTVDFNQLGFKVEGPPRDNYNFDATRQCGLRLEFLTALPEWEPGEQE